MNSGAEDRFDQAERQHEEGRLHAEFLAGVLGMGETQQPAEGEPKRDEQGRFARVGSADAGEKSAPMPQKRTHSQELYRAIFGYDHDDVPPWIDQPPRR